MKFNLNTHSCKILIWLKSQIAALWALIQPPHCAVCRGLLAGGEQGICIRCREDIPLTGFHLTPEQNPLMELFERRVRVVSAVSLFYYDKRSPYSSIVKDLKYRGKRDIHHIIMPLFCRVLRESTTFKDIDVVVPVPLHPKRKRRRGFNQSDYIAEPIAEMLEVELDKSSVVRSINNPPQARGHDKANRDINVEGIFTLKDPSSLEGKHILIVDDVITTGATIHSMCEALERGLHSYKISICSLSSVKRVKLR